ncbi:MAG: ferredoxin [Proteobacteria bacterium]|nr:ferredoxin [Pseudomonadota bacterium]
MPHRLGVFGAFHLSPEDGLPEAFRTLVLLGPDEPGFWPHLTAQPEWQDGAPDPVDRWSRRVIGGIACDLGGKAHFPFGGPPYRPFYQWALKSGRAWVSPVTLLVHDRAGLMLSYRGAIALRDRLDLPAPPAASPCEGCDEKPCLTACPPAALGAKGYDVPACHKFLDTPSGADCLSSGCGLRRACPVSRGYGRLPQQSAYHMRLFHR